MDNKYKFTPEQKLKLLGLYVNFWVKEYPEREWDFESFLKNRETEYSIKREFKTVSSSNCKCFYCDKPFAQNAKSTIDHLIPLSRGGGNEKDNLVSACYNCNSWKSNKSLKIWLYDLYLIRRLKMFGGYYPKGAIDRMIYKIEVILKAKKAAKSSGHNQRTINQIAQLTYDINSSHERLQQKRNRFKV